MAISTKQNRTSGIVVGSPVTGDDFFDREDELAELRSLLQGGASILVTAPRRIGKTSLLLEAQRRLKDEFAFLFVDVQSCRSEADCIVRLALEAKEHRAFGHKVLDTFRSTLGGLLSHIDEVALAELKLKLREGLTADWEGKADDVLERLAQAELPVVVWFDEYPVLVSTLLFGDDGHLTTARVDVARVFLSWLRRASIRHRAKIRFVISGSIGLEPLLARAGISETINTLTPLPIGPWDRRVAQDYIRDRAERIGASLEEGADELLLDKLGYLIPHHVAMFMHFVRRDLACHGETVCTRTDIDRIYENDMLSVHGHADLATYEDRLRRVVPVESFAPALELLTEAAVVGVLSAKAAMIIVRSHGFSGRESADNLRFLLGVFEHDGYLKRAGDDYRFVSALLRDWWSPRFGFGYLQAELRGECRS
jgi:uncharacterized protein